MQLNSVNYTHILRDAMAYGINVVVQLVAERPSTGQLSLSWDLADPFQCPKK